MRINRVVTLTGSPQQISELFGFNNAGQQGTPMYIQRIFCQMLIGGTNPGYIMDGYQGSSTPDPTGDDLTAQLAPASASAPGGSYSDTSPENYGGGIIGSQFYIQGTAAEKMVVSVNIKN